MRFFLDRNTNCKDIILSHNVVHVEYWNFGTTATPEEVRSIFASNENIVSFTGNDFVSPVFPRCEKASFHRAFAIRPKYSQCAVKRPCVAHLRKGDNQNDWRPGLDESTRILLGTTFPDCHLITNNVHWYAEFENFGWTNSRWKSIEHSAFSAESDLNDFQMWSDWCSILNAKFVIHTPSAFSESAIRLSEVYTTSKRIVGSKNQQLIIADETWLQ